MAGFVTREAARERFRELSDQVDAAYAEMRELSTDEVGNEFRVEMAERLETQERTNRGLMYRVFGEIADPPDEVECVPVLADKLWARLRIPPKEIKRRMKVARRIRPRGRRGGPPQGAAPSRTGPRSRHHRRGSSAGHQPRHRRAALVRIGRRSRRC
jgi:hypothetical protein